MAIEYLNENEAYYFSDFLIRSHNNNSVLIQAINNNVINICIYPVASNSIIIESYKGTLTKQKKDKQ
jgi:hypothetical protein